MRKPRRTKNLNRLMAPDSSCSAMSRRVMRNPLITKKTVTPTGPQTSTTPAPNRRWRPTFSSFSAWPRTTIAAEIPRSPSSDGSRSGNDRASRVACASKTPPPRTKLRTFYRERTDPIVRTGRSLVLARRRGDASAAIATWPILPTNVEGRPASDLKTRGPLGRITRSTSKDSQARGAPMQTQPAREHLRFLENRWLILFFSVLSMRSVANFQYGWALFVLALQKHLRAEQAAVQVTFTVFVLLETWLVPFEGWLVDRFGPRLLVMIGGVCAGLGWVGSGKAESLTALYLSYALAGLGAGVVYGTAIGSALKWFPDHRGLAAGLTAAGFGAGSALTVYPIANMINTQGYQHAFIYWGIVQGAVVIVCALFLRAPPQGWLPHEWKNAPRGEEVKKRQSAIEFTSFQMAATSQFWVMYFMMALVATGGLMATAQLNPMAVDFKVDKVPIHFLWLTLPALQFALSADRVLNGICRPIRGWISDHIGRELTMTIAFTLEACAIFLLIRFASNPTAFVVFSAFTFFGWGEIYSLMPAVCGDFFGRKHATANYGFLYTAKGTASVFVPIGSALAAGKAFDFRADFLLVLGGLLVLFALFVAPTALRLELGRNTKAILLALAGVLITYGIILTVIPTVWTPFHAKFTLPKTGWAGVFRVAIFFDVAAAVLAFFVLRRMKAPVPREVSGVAQHLAPAKVRGVA